MSSAAVELSPEEAATKLGKSVRQIRYMMQEGRLPARKVGGRWRVKIPAAPTGPAVETAKAQGAAGPAAAPPGPAVETAKGQGAAGPAAIATPAQGASDSAAAPAPGRGKSDGPRQQAAARKQARLRAAVEDALELDRAPRRYSLRDLKAFQLGLPLYQQALAVLGAEHGACRALRQMLEQLSCGCHRFDSADKATAYRAARDAASQAVCELLLLPAPGGAGLVDGIEQELMAALAGLLRRLDSLRRSRRDS